MIEAYGAQVDRGMKKTACRRGVAARRAAKRRERRIVEPRDRYSHPFDYDAWINPFFVDMATLAEDVE